MKAYGLALVLSAIAPSLATAQWILLAPPADEATTCDYSEAAHANLVEIRANSHIAAGRRITEATIASQ